MQGVPSRNWRIGIRTSPDLKTDQNKTMNREIITMNDLAFANLLDLIQLISNTGEEVDPIILQLYERNAGAFDEN